MQISATAHSEIICPACSGRQLTFEWVAIDLIERPDLRTYLASGDWLASPCTHCGNSVARTVPLLATRISPLAPVLLALSRQRLAAGGNVLAESAALMESVRARMGSIQSEVPGPVLLVPFDLLTVVASRDLAVDSEDINSALATLLADGPQAAQDYRAFLSTVRESNPERRMNYALGHLIPLSSQPELEILFSQYPELCNEQAREIVRGRLTGAATDEERHVQTTCLAILERAGAGDFPGAWATYQSMVSEMSVKFFMPRVLALAESLARFEQQREWQAAQSIAEELLDIGRRSGAEHIEVQACLSLAGALFELPGAGLAGRLERAVALLQRAIEIYRSSENDLER